MNPITIRELMQLVDMFPMIETAINEELANQIQGTELALLRDMLVNPSNYNPDGTLKDA